MSAAATETSTDAAPTSTGRPIGRALIFVSVLGTLWFSAHALVLVQAARAFAFAATPVIWGAVMGVGLAAFIALLGSRPEGRTPNFTFRAILFAYAGSLSVLFAFSLVALPFSLLAGLASDVAARSVAGAGIAIGAGASLLALVQGQRRAPLVEVDIPVEGLHPDLDGYRIAMLSDVHVGAPTTRAEFDEVVDTTLAAEADLIAFVGDLVDGSVSALRDHVSPIDRLKARDGTFFVTGNHEYYSDALPWEAEVARRGIRVLSNEHDRISVGDATLVVAGISDASAGQFVPADASNPEKALADTADADFRLLLAHQPALIDRAAKAGADLQLSGHTHGGQFVPWTWLVGLFNPYSKGLHRHADRTWIYVSCGSATWGPPMRLGAPTEVTALTLRRV